MKQIFIPQGFRFAGVHCGIKSASKMEDVTLIVADHPCVAAGVYTKNQVVAAPVVLDRQRTPSDSIRAVVINSGNANACTGEQGFADAERMLALAAEVTGAASGQTLVMSTGIIGEPLPMPTVEAGIAAAASQLDSAEANLHAAARGIMTTDTKSKIASRRIESDSPISIVGIAKGSGMIGPNMATMLGAIMTDATLTPEVAQELLAELTEDSFNAINVDGHTSTNDTVLLLASGQGNPLTGSELESFKSALREVCVELAKMIVDDGEGATHLVEIAISGAESKQDARIIAESIANSPLVKTAIAGNDPNWGRIVSAAGYAGPKIDVNSTQLKLNGTTLFDRGQPVAFDAANVSKHLQANRDVLIELRVGDGDGTTRYWTCDLTHEYVTINAEYHT